MAGAIKIAPPSVRYRLELEALPGADPDARLKRALKYLLRVCGLRCKHVSLIEPREKP